MKAADQEFLDRLRLMFRTEAEEHLRALSLGLIELEKTTGAERRAEILEGIFREAHSLKGAARSVDLKEVETICQPLESVLAELKRQEIPFSPALCDLMLGAVDSIEQLVSTMGAERSSADRVKFRELSRRLAEAAQGGIPPSEPEQAQPAAETLVAEAEPQASPQAALAVPARPVEPFPSTLEGDLPPLPTNAVTPRASPELPLVETVRIPMTKLDPLLLQAEEMIQAKLAAAQRAAELREIQQVLSSWKIESEKWTSRSDANANQLPEWAVARLDALADKVNTVRQAFEQDQRALRHMVDDHLEAMKQVLMLPISTLVEVFPRLVRDLARDQGKEVDLTVRGEKLEIDKRILEELKDPLIHMLRNCVDHGIEKPEMRARLQKPARATITLAFNAKDNRQVEILISDDGRGIDMQLVRAASIRAGVITAEAAEQLSPQETLALIFQSGISTNKIITDISGRGLGLAIAREKVLKLGGQVAVDTRENLGTTFRLLLPLTLSTFRGVLVRVHDQVFVLPTANIDRAVRVIRKDIQTVENRETIRLDGQILALVNLGDVLALPVRNENMSRPLSATEAAAERYGSVLILSVSEARIAVQVDEVLGEEEILVKGLGKQLRRVRNISGATVLGNGRVVPVLNAGELMNSALHPGMTVKASTPAEKILARTGHILVAEDSITSRSLLKNILEAGGYQVTTAVDGVDAYTQLRSGEFDLVVSDVDMPRLSGFELTTRIRGNKKLGELPVVLVTSLESRPDRERGIEVGANAYIIKSSFDQSNLLEVIGRLL